MNNAVADPLCCDAASPANLDVTELRTHVCALPCIANRLRSSRIGFAIFHQTTMSGVFTKLTVTVNFFPVSTTCEAQLKSSPLFQVPYSLVAIR